MSHLSGYLTKRDGNICTILQMTDCQITEFLADYDCETYINCTRLLHGMEVNGPGRYKEFLNCLTTLIVNIQHNHNH
jgi:hypothetical protein